MIINKDILLKLVISATVLTASYVYIFIGYYLDTNKCDYQLSYFINLTHPINSPPYPCTLVAPMNAKQIFINKLLLKPTYETYLLVENGKLVPITDISYANKFNKQVLSVLVLYDRYGMDKAMSFAKTTSMVPTVLSQKYQGQSQPLSKILVFVVVDSELKKDRQALADLGYDLNVESELTNDTRYNELNMVPLYVSPADLSTIARLNFVKGITTRITYTKGVNIE